MTDTAVETATNNNETNNSNNAKGKGRGRPKKEEVKKGKSVAVSLDGDKPDVKASDNLVNDGAESKEKAEALPPARGRTSQRKASLAASTAMKEQAQGANKRDAEGDEDVEPKTKKTRGRPKAPPKKKAEKPPKKGGKGKGAKGASKKKAPESESEGAEGNTEAEESHGE